MRARLFLIPLALSSAGCSQADEYRKKVGASEEGGAAASPQVEAVKAEPVAVEEETERYIFGWSYPREAAAIPALADYLDRRAAASRADMIEEADRDFEAAKGEGWAARQHSAATEWKVVAETPGWLSLSGEVATYSGGAHGNYNKVSLLWDKQTRRAMKGIDLFASPVALRNALGPHLCGALNAERAERRGEPVPADGEGMFDQCPGLDEATILVGSSNGEKFDRIAVYFGPYVAGPYAEGAYELDFPVTGAVIDAVKPEYAYAFAIQR